MNIEYVSKEEIYPKFGYYCSRGTIKIRKDLPKCAQDFLLHHELAHQDDIIDNESFIEKELESNWRGFIRHPIGAIVIMFMSLAPYRLKYYWQRFKTKQ